MRTTIGLVLKSAVALILWMMVTDVAGVIFCSFWDVMPFDKNSAALPYVVWFVFGVFCGLFAFSSAGAWAAKPGVDDWMRGSEAPRTGKGIFATGVVVILMLAAFFYHIYWSKGVVGEYYVPDSAPHSIVFFVAVLGGLALGKVMLTPPSAKP